MEPTNLRRLGKSDLMITSLGWGMWRFAGIEVKAAQELVESVFEAGINFFDTADIYGFQNPKVGFGDAEALLGEVFKQAPSLRSKMVLASKGGIIPPTPYNSSYDYLVNACEASLRRLNPDVTVVTVDLLGRLDPLASPQAQEAEYDRLVAALREATLVLSDSGGIQEEAPALGKPVLVLRRTTERPEAVDAGTARLIGTDSAAIVTEAAKLLDDPAAYDAMARAHNPFGDGQASGRIVEAARRLLRAG
jgi:aryl-alcohol dehydrogenase-like predicted oxidoreductase